MTQNNTFFGQKSVQDLGYIALPGNFLEMMAGATYTRKRKGKVHVLPVPANAWRLFIAYCKWANAYGESWYSSARAAEAIGVSPEVVAQSRRILLAATFEGSPLLASYPWARSKVRTPALLTMRVRSRITYVPSRDRKAKSIVCQTCKASAIPVITREGAALCRSCKSCVGHLPGPTPPRSTPAGQVADHFRRASGGRVAHELSPADLVSADPPALPIAALKGEARLIAEWGTGRARSGNVEHAEPVELEDDVEHAELVELEDDVEHAEPVELEDDVEHAELVELEDDVEHAEPVDELRRALHEFEDQRPALVGMFTGLVVSPASTRDHLRLIAPDMDARDWAILHLEVLAWYVRRHLGAGAGVSIEAPPKGGLGLISGTPLGLIQGSTLGPRRLIHELAPGGATHARVRPRVCDTRTRAGLSAAVGQDPPPLRGGAPAPASPSLPETVPQTAKQPETRHHLGTKTSRGRHRNRPTTDSDNGTAAGFEERQSGAGAVDRGGE